MAPESLDRRVIRTSVDWSGSGIALDIYLAGRFTYRSLEEWRDRIRGGEILLNGELSAPDRILALHDRIEYFPGDLPEPEADLRYRIAYEDEELLVVDKSGNLCVHPSGPFSGIRCGICSVRNTAGSTWSTGSTGRLRDC